MTARDACVMFVIDIGACARCATTTTTKHDDDDCIQVVGGMVRDAVRAHVMHRTASAREHAMGLVVYGTSETENAVAESARRDGGDGDEYAGICARGRCEAPDASRGEEYREWIVRASPARDGGGGGDDDDGSRGERAGTSKGTTSGLAPPADAAEAVAVACDEMIRKYSPDGVTAAVKKRLANARKDIILITDVAGARTIPSADDDAFVSTLLEGMSAQNIRLRVGILDDAKHARLAVLRDITRRLAGEDASNESDVTSAMDLLHELQLKRVRLTAGFRGVLSFGQWCGLNVCMYKLNTEAKPVKANKYSEELADRADESHRTLVDVAYKNVNDLDGELVPVERHVRAFRYGKQHIPIDGETESRLSMKFDKGVKIIGSVALDEVPLWLSTGEPSVMCAQPSTKTTGLSQERVDADAKALSAIARALDDAKLALLVRGAWTENSSVVHIGALTPHLTDTGDFLLYTPLPFKEDYNEYQLPPKPKAQRVPPSDARLDAARDFVNACTIDVNENHDRLPWQSLNPTLRDTRDLCAARATNAPAPKRKRLDFSIDERAALALASTFQLASSERGAHAGPAPSRLRLDAADEVTADEVAADVAAEAAAPGERASPADESVWIEVKREPESELQPEPQHVVREPHPSKTVDLDVFDDME